MNHDQNDNGGERMMLRCDVLVVGAATTGVYLGYILAKKGHNVIIIDKEARDKVGTRLEIIHFNPRVMRELGIPITSDPPELLFPWKGILVSRLPLFLQRMYKILEADGAKLEFGCEFKELVMEGGRIAGAKVLKQGAEVEIKTRLVIDASGTACVVRSRLPDDYGVDTWRFDSTNQFYVILHYIKWSNPGEPHPEWGDVRAYYYQFFDPGYTRDEAIMGIAGPESFEKAALLMKEIIDRFKYPPFELKKKEFGYFAYSRPPYSLVGDGFLCVGDAASTVNYVASRAIPETWRICKIAGKVVDAALKSEAYLSRDILWAVNARHFRNEGAELAYMYMLSPAVHGLSEKEIDFLLDKLRPLIDPGSARARADGAVADPGKAKELQGLAADNGEGGGQEITLSPGLVAAATFKVLGALLARKVSFKSLVKFVKALSLAGKAKKLYQSYPGHPGGFDAWRGKAERLWAERKPSTRQFITTRATYP
nr:FAD-dependent monooxygenase [Candidatus Sigynarchaeota archaeon]